MQQDSVQLSMAQFKKGSFIIVEGKLDSNEFYIIRSGKVQIQKEDEIVEDEAGNVLNPGDFFGVVSTMSGHPRIESAIALTDVTVIIIKKDQFGVLIQKNAPIALKIIRSFSRKLRYFDSAVTRMSFKNAVEENPSYLFQLGEFYFGQRLYLIASHAFNKYIQYNPTGSNLPQARQRISELAQYIQSSPPVQTEGFSRSYPDNGVIFLEHELGDELYILQQGKVKITKIVDNNEIMLAVLEPGDIFGEMAILENKPRSASGISFGESVMLAINRDNFQNMVTSQPQLATKIITLLSERIWTSYRQLSTILISDPLGKLYDVLLTQVEKNRIKVDKNASYTFQFGTKELITMVGLPEDKGRIYIRNLFENKKFKLVENKILISDLEELAKQVSYYRKMTRLERQREDSHKY